MKNKLLLTLIGTLLISMNLSSCNTSDVELSSVKPAYQLEDHTDNYIDDVYRNYYQVLVYSYFDSNGDGIGDLNGLRSKLDYLNNGNKNSEDSLGYDGIYTLPIFPSPTYHKYDATDYYNIDPDYGTLEDFDNLISDCNERGIDVILDLAINHSSYQHPWFIKACQDINNVTEFDPLTGEPTEDAKNMYPSIRYYHFVNKNGSYVDANWHVVPGTDWLYEGSFNSGMPDLNLEEQVVLDEIKNILKFWLDRGVRGFRLDAVQHYFDYNVSKNYDLLNQLVAWGKELTKDRDKDCFFVAEGPWGASVSNYYKNVSDMSFMNFNFASGGQSKLLNTLNNSALYNNKIRTLEKEGIEIIYSTKENNFGKEFNIMNDNADVRCAADYYRAIVENWMDTLYEANPNAIDSNFGVNHDTSRLSNQLFNNFGSKKSKLLQACKFFWALNNTLSGITFNYYGEEIGMRYPGASEEENKDPNKRHPMYWSEKNKTGMTNYAPGGLKTEQYFAPADEQMKDENSLWNFIREINRMKNTFPEIARGKQSFVHVDKYYVVMEKEYNDKSIYLLYNFSDEARSFSLKNLGLEEEPTEIKYSLSSSFSHYSKISAETLNVPAYSITII